MPNYRRAIQPGGMFFFTIVAAKRRPILTADPARPLLRQAIREAQNARPFEIIATVLLPDHLHLLMQLPPNDGDFSTRISHFKARFTNEWLKHGGSEVEPTANERIEGRRGVWQQRFFEHMIRDDTDLGAHLDYIHFNPVKHGLVTAPKHWLWSSFHRYVKDGMYDIEWGGQDVDLKRLNSLNAELIE